MIINSEYSNKRRQPDSRTQSRNKPNFKKFRNYDKKKLVFLLVFIMWSELTRERREAVWETMVGLLIFIYTKGEVIRLVVVNLFGLLHEIFCTYRFTLHNL